MKLNLTQRHETILRTTTVRVGSIVRLHVLKNAGLAPFLELTNTTGNSHKFWMIEMTNHGLMRRWGRIGTYGQAKPFTTKSSAKVFNEKLNKGYVVQEPVGSFPVKVTEVRSNGDLIELVSHDGTVVWADTPHKALKVLAVCQ